MSDDSIRSEDIPDSDLEEIENEVIGEENAKGSDFESLDESDLENEEEGLNIRNEESSKDSEL